MTTSLRKRSALALRCVWVALCLAILSGCSDGSGADSSPSWVRRWNGIAIDASGLDHTPPAPGEQRVHGEQLGPGRASRAMAIVHIAMFEAINAVSGEYDSYLDLEPAAPNTSLKAAVAQAAHDTLSALFPAQSDHFTALLLEDLGHVDDVAARDAGVALGSTAAAAILARRANDGAAHAEPRLGVDWFTSPEIGHWSQDPISQHPLALGAHWYEVEPFVLDRADQFRLPPPPPVGSLAYATAYDEVRALGGDGVVTPTLRTEEQTFIGTFWAYDGMPSLCAPPRLYNQVALAVADDFELTLPELARLLALVNVAMADAGIAAWESKYHYDLWRPVMGIRVDDGNPETETDASFTPLGAPASNLSGPNFTPPFPAYPSGHAAFGGALFQTLRAFFGRDDIAFTFVSDEFNGTTRDNQGNLRPLRPRHYDSLAAAEEENGQSRIYLGIHWAFDKTGGIDLGRQVADHTIANLFRPRT